MYATRQHKESTGRMHHQPEKKRTAAVQIEDNRGRKMHRKLLKP